MLKIKVIYMSSEEKKDILIVGAGYNSGITNYFLKRASDVIVEQHGIPIFNEKRGKGKAKNRKTRWD